MKKFKISACLLLMFSVYFQGFSQKILESLTYEQTQDLEFFRNVKNKTEVLKYTSVSGNVIKVGDTLIIGKPTSSETTTTSNSVSYGNNLRGGRTNSRSVNTKTFEFIQLGRPAGVGVFINALAGESANMASNSLSNTTVIVNEMKAYHKGSKKKPLYLVMVLGEINGRAFGVNKYLSVMNTELAIEQGEIYLKNRKMTREEAISKLKESKELFDLELMTKADYDKIKKELTPIIMNKN